MAGEGARRVLGLKCFLILCIIVRIHTLGDTSTRQVTVQDQHEHSTGNYLLSYYKLQGFNGYFLLNDARKKSSKWLGYPGTILLNKPKLGHITQIIFVALARAGDIESQPGPRSATTSTNKKRKYIIKIQCQACLKGVRARPVSCNTCENITHARCITGMTPEIYDNYINNLEVIPHICKFCVNPSGINNSIVSSEEMLEHTKTPTPRQTENPSPFPLTHSNRPMESGEEGGWPRPPMGEQNNSHDTNLTTRTMHCQYCEDSFEVRKTKRLCNHCKNIFHSKCFKKVSKKEQNVLFVC